MVNRSELAAFFGVSGQTVDAWVRKGLRKTNGGFNTAEVAEWRAAQAVERVAPSDNSSANLDMARRRKVEAEAELAELDLAARRGKLIEVEKSTRILAEILTAVRAKLLAMPDKLTPMLAIEGSERGCRVILDNGVAEVLDALVSDAQRERARLASPRRGRGDDAGAAAADGVGMGGLLSEAFT